MKLFFWFKRKKRAQDAKDAEREKQITEIHDQIFKDAEEARKITKEVNKLLEGKEVDIAHQIFLATRRGRRK